MLQIRQILAPTDFSAFSKQAVDDAYGLAQTFGAKLVLLHVIELPAYPIEGFVPPGGAAMLLEDLERQARLDLAAMLPAAKDAEVTRQVVVGTPYREIVRVAAVEKVDSIVMVTHGRTGLSHLFMGSLAEHVVCTAPGSVLTMRPSAATA